MPRKTVFNSKEEREKMAKAACAVINKYFETHKNEYPNVKQPFYTEQEILDWCNDEKRLALSEKAYSLAIKNYEKRLLSNGKKASPTVYSNNANGNRGGFFEYELGDDPETIKHNQEVTDTFANVDTNIKYCNDAVKDLINCDAREFTADSDEKAVELYEKNERLINIGFNVTYLVTQIGNKNPPLTKQVSYVKDLVEGGETMDRVHFIANPYYMLIPLKEGMNSDILANVLGKLETEVKNAAPDVEGIEPMSNGATYAMNLINHMVEFTKHLKMKNIPNISRVLANTNNITKDFTKTKVLKYNDEVVTSIQATKLCEEQKLIDKLPKGLVVADADKDLMEQIEKYSRAIDFKAKIAGLRKNLNELNEFTFTSDFDDLKNDLNTLIRDYEATLQSQKENKVDDTVMTGLFENKNKNLLDKISNGLDKFDKQKDKLLESLQVAERIQNKVNQKTKDTYDKGYNGTGTLGTESVFDIQREAAKPEEFQALENSKFKNTVQIKSILNDYKKPLTEEIMSNSIIAIAAMNKKEEEFSKRGFFGRLFYGSTNTSMLQQRNTLIEELVARGVKKDELLSIGKSDNKYPISGVIGKAIVDQETKRLDLSEIAKEAIDAFITKPKETIDNLEKEIDTLVTQKDVAISEVNAVKDSIISKVTEGNMNLIDYNQLSRSKKSEDIAKFNEVNSKIKVALKDPDTKKAYDDAHKKRDDLLDVISDKQYEVGYRKQAYEKGEIIGESDVIAKKEQFKNNPQAKQDFATRLKNEFVHKEAIKEQQSKSNDKNEVKKDIGANK